MLKKIPFICLAIFFLACDDESNNTKETSDKNQDATLEADASVSDATPPIQHYDFNEMEIKPSLDMGN